MFRFQPRISETAYIHIVKGTGCSSSIGRTGSAQAVSLGNGCVYTGQRTRMPMPTFQLYPLNPLYLISKVNYLNSAIEDDQFSKF